MYGHQGGDEPWWIRFWKSLVLFKLLKAAKDTYSKIIMHPCFLWKKQARWPISIFIYFKRASNDEHFGTFWRMPRQFLRVKLPFFIFSPFNPMLNRNFPFFAIISKTRTEAYIKCGTDEFRMEKRTVWCIACICPAKSKRFEYVSFALLSIEYTSNTRMEYKLY